MLLLHMIWVMISFFFCSFIALPNFTSPSVGGILADNSCDSRVSVKQVCNTCIVVVNGVVNLYFAIHSKWKSETKINVITLSPLHRYTASKGEKCAPNKIKTPLPSDFRETHRLRLHNSALYANSIAHNLSYRLESTQRASTNYIHCDIQTIERIILEMHK